MSGWSMDSWRVDNGGQVALDRLALMPKAALVLDAHQRPVPEGWDSWGEVCEQLAVFGPFTADDCVLAKHLTQTAAALRHALQRQGDSPEGIDPRGQDALEAAGSGVHIRWTFAPNGMHHDERTATQAQTQWMAANRLTHSERHAAVHAPNLAAAAKELSHARSMGGSGGWTETSYYDGKGMSVRDHRGNGGRATWLALLTAARSLHLAGGPTGTEEPLPHDEHTALTLTTTAPVPAPLHVGRPSRREGGVPQGVQLQLA